MNVVADHFGEILAGFGCTVLLTLVSFAAALILGGALGLCRVAPLRVLRAVASCYVQIVRNLPLLLVVVVTVFVLPQLGLTLPLETSVTVGLAVYIASYICEILRSGMETVPAGQVEAARAVGLSTAQCLRLVVLPQALRAMVQPLGNMFIATALGTAVGSVAGVNELSGVIRQLNVQYVEPIALFASATVLYVALTLAGGLITGGLERRLRVRR
ncbi:amino acid ABC transporter permease [Streptomyces sp. SID10853]|uniref:ABC transporter permease subunit n=1 Tax=Streptomyces sp. SID10853 TaxID=2706028 RepID=UPI0013C09985|nr:amino acid ABC transporter permease [Streptomyces sp. SID10853]